MATSNKYDRQLRLWGAQGQKALAETRVVSVGASAAGTETLKNLVLPGIGAFTVMDFVDEPSVGNQGGSHPATGATGRVTEKDAASNFFLPLGDAETKTETETESVATRAEVACKHLGELNPDVAGSFRNLPLDGSPRPDAPSFWKTVLEEESLRATSDSGAKEPGGADESQPPKTSRLLVVAADLVPDVLEALAKACWDSGHPLVAVTSYGLIGTVRLQLPEKGAVLLQPKPTNSPPDLRLVTSFPAFRDFFEDVVGGDSLGAMDSAEHGHVPYPVLLAKAMEGYRAAANSKAGDTSGDGPRDLPRTYAQKQDFVNNYVKPMARDYDQQLNFQEAVSNAYLAYTERDLGWMDLLASTVARESKLGRLRSALETFLEEHPDHRPPLNGSVPDMTASTALYVRLQQLYKDQAGEDLRTMARILEEQQRQEPEGRQLEPVTGDDLANFCANVYSVGHARTRSLADEDKGEASTPGELQDLLDDWKAALMDPCEVPVHTPLLWYLGVRAAQAFCQREGRYPGCVDVCGTAGTGQLEEDASLLEELLRETIFPRYGLGGEDLLSSREHTEQIARELARYGNAEVHAVASVVGGVAAQEAVKVVTGQYVPLDNTYVYNGIVSVGGVYRF